MVTITRTKNISKKCNSGFTIAVPNMNDAESPRYKPLFKLINVIAIEENSMQIMNDTKLINRVS